MNPPTTLTNHNPPATIGCGLNPNPIRREESDTPQPCPYGVTMLTLAQTSTGLADACGETNRGFGCELMGEIGVNLGPLIAGAGIGGVALGFGAQSIVKDFLSGLFMLIEDHYGVGDWVDLGYASGTVEEVSLRSTTIRDIKGTVWHIPNGEISRVGNFSQLWSKALIDIEVSYDTDVRVAMGVMQRVADELWSDPEWGGDEVSEAPAVFGIQSLGASGVGLRLSVKTEPSMQWAVEREIRLRLKEAFDEAGIEIPFPQQTVWFGDQSGQPANTLSEAEQAAFRALYEQKHAPRPDGDELDGPR